MQTQLTLVPQYQFDNESGSCGTCTQRFSIVTWRHHCRACGRANCKSCLSRVRFADGSLNKACNGCIVRQVQPAVSPQAAPYVPKATGQTFAMASAPPPPSVYSAATAAAIVDSCVGIPLGYAQSDMMNQQQPPPAANGLSDPTLAAKIAAVMQKHEINPKYTNAIARLIGYDIVLVCDDSGSMNNVADAEVPNVSRWMELQQYVGIVLDISLLFDRSIDIYFINRGVYRGVSSVAQLQTYFQKPPGGYTDIIGTLRQVFSDRSASGKLGPMIVHLFTDGHPTDRSGNEDISSFSNYLRYRPNISANFIAILLCTDDEEVEDTYRPMEDKYFTQMKRFAGGSSNGIKGVDVTLDYRGEKKDVIMRRGMNYRFSFGDYIVKCLVGCIDVEIHAIDLPTGNRYRR